MIYFDGTLVLYCRLILNMFIYLFARAYGFYSYFLVNGYGDEYCLLHNLGF